MSNFQKGQFSCPYSNIYLKNVKNAIVHHLLKFKVNLFSLSGDTPIFENQYVIQKNRSFNIKLTKKIYLP